MYIITFILIYRGCQKENVTPSTSRHQQMKESISMGQIQATGNYPDAVPAKMLGGLNNGNKGRIFCFKDTLGELKHNFSYSYVNVNNKYVKNVNCFLAMSANVVNDPAAVIETDRPHKSSMALTRATADKASSVPRRR